MQHIGDPVISSLTEVEFFSLVAKKHRQKELTEPKARRVLGTFTAHVADGYYRRLMLSAEHYAKARSLVGSFNTTLHTLDALHLAVTVSEKLPLLTADAILAAAARRFRVKTTLELISKFVRPERSAEGTKSKGSKCLNFQCFDFAELCSATLNTNGLEF